MLNKFIAVILFDFRASLYSFSKWGHKLLVFCLFLYFFHGWQLFLLLWMILMMVSSIAFILKQCFMLDLISFAICLVQLDIALLSGVLGQHFGIEKLNIFPLKCVMGRHLLAWVVRRVIVARTQQRLSICHLVKLGQWAVLLGVYPGKILRKEGIWIELVWVFVVICSSYCGWCSDVFIFMTTLVWVYFDEFALDPVAVGAIVAICGVLKALI